IPLGARILSAVDCLDALASDRPYRRALPLDEAAKFIQAESGKSYDPTVVDILVRRYKAFEALALNGRKRKELAKLSRDEKMEAGEAPGGGFEKEPESPEQAAQPAEFLMSIAAARHEAQALFELAQTLGSSLSLHDTLSVMGGRLKKLVPFDAMAVY